MICPGCGSTEVRKSRRSRWGDLFPRIRGRQAFRCRSCRARFHGAAEAAPAASRSRSGGLFRGHRHGPGRGSKRLRRRVLEIAIFLLMLVVFYLFLRYLTRETIPAGESGLAPHWSAISLA